MNREQQLEWERMRAPAAAGAAFGAVLLQIAAFLIQLPAISDAPRADDPFRYRETLLNFKEHSGVLLGSGVANILASFAAAGALYYLFRATRHRRAELPAMVQWLLAAAPVFLAVAVIANWVGLSDASDRYAQAGAVSTLERSELSDDERQDVRDYCRRRGAGCLAASVQLEATAKKQVEDSRGVVGTAAGFAGTLAIAFAYVIISLNAMRAGLLSRFMGILGIGVGVLIVLPLLPQGLPIVQMFWLGALGLLILGRWAGGRGPAWETGMSEPWPTAADRQQAAAEPEPDPEPPEDEEHVARRSSRKRKRKRR
ncbi:MAG: hypothetical protein JW895_12715 [Thermoleophilaceae bacterium]|nr:hypothetical protein [Thermoleophilaceae bacterium]